MAVTIAVEKTEAVDVSVAIAMSVRECHEDVKLVAGGKPWPWP